MHVRELPHDNLLTWWNIRNLASVEIYLTSTCSILNFMFKLTFSCYMQVYSTTSGFLFVFLCFVSVCVKILNDENCKTKENFYKKCLFMEFSFNRIVIFKIKGLVILSIDLVIISYFTFVEFLINELDKIFVMFDIHTSCRGVLFFQSFVGFFAWLRWVGFTIFNWCKTDRGKTRNDLTRGVTVLF
jgi:hypothetical protein